MQLNLSFIWCMKTYIFVRNLTFNSIEELSKADLKLKKKKLIMLKN